LGSCPVRGAGKTAWAYLEQVWQRHASLESVEGQVCVYRVRSQLEVSDATSEMVVPFEGWARVVDGNLINVHD
jgi:hypothetical protein